MGLSAEVSAGIGEKERILMISRGLSYYEIADGLFEIDEFDCASIFVIIGEERALVLDTGTGIGDLKWVIENRITCKPYEVALTHAHPDHIGGAGWFDKIWIHPADDDRKKIDLCRTVSNRRKYAELIREREGKSYEYSPDTDIRSWPGVPSFEYLHDASVFELGNRRVIAYECPGHTPGSMVYLDEKSRTLLVGDACNGYYILDPGAFESQKEAASAAYLALRRIYDMRDRYDKIYNFHHDFRKFGSALDLQVMKDTMTGLKKIAEDSDEVIVIENDFGGEVKTVQKYGACVIDYAGVEEMLS